MFDHSSILKTDISGMPLEWLHYTAAVKLYCTGQIAYSCGLPLQTIRGGFNAITGKRSQVHLNSIIATHGSQQQLHNGCVPSLNNPTLFRRDDQLCLYCGEKFHHKALSRDHITPIVQGGEDSWTNVVTACRHCNSRKGGRTPELAIPFQPNYAEYVYLLGRNILVDQMELLSAHFPRNSPLHRRFKQK